jgi:hypothetical protein
MNTLDFPLKKTVRNKNLDDLQTKEQRSVLAAASKLLGSRYSLIHHPG